MQKTKSGQVCAGWKSGQAYPLERAEESLRISLAAYREGGADLLRLLDARRVRNEVRLLFTRTEIEFRLSRAELENSVGEEDIVVAEELLRVQP